MFPIFKKLFLFLFFIFRIQALGCGRLACAFPPITPRCSLFFLLSTPIKLSQSFIQSLLLLGDFYLAFPCEGDTVTVFLGERADERVSASSQEVMGERGETNQDEGTATPGGREGGHF